MSEWVSVDDGMPEDNVPVYAKGCDYRKMEYVRDYFQRDKEQWHYIGIRIHNILSGRITHWMPLPEAPKNKDTGA